MTDDMGFDLKLPDVGELTFPQWRDWLAQYNKFIGERDVRYAAGLRERDERIEKLEAALRELSDGWPCCSVSQTMRDVAREALEGKDG
tara:strand:+ start:55 stop:318 length:264 start_codon:yes stop_codon:yes gene_type:complete